MKLLLNLQSVSKNISHVVLSMLIIVHIRITSVTSMCNSDLTHEIEACSSTIHFCIKILDSGYSVIW